MGGAIAAIPGIPLAALGVTAKWIDLTIRFDQFAHKGPAMSYHLPMILEIYSRLGDRLTAYLNTKYVAEKYGLPVYFKPFKGSEFFAFSQEETLRQPLYFKKIVHLKSAADVLALSKVDPAESVLYLFPFFPHTRIENESEGCSYIKYFVNWDAFKPRVKQLLKVVQPHEKIAIPADTFSIALHVRTGGDYDNPDTSTMLPLKLPPMEFYLGELENLLRSNDLPRKPLFIHIFTDDLHPKKIFQKVKERLDILGFKGPTISYSESPRLIDDVANMNRFDCLIRPDSNLSGTLAEAADHLQLEIFPTHFTVNSHWSEISINQVKKVFSNGNKESVNSNYTMPAIKRLPTFFYKWFHRYFLGIQTQGG